MIENKVLLDLAPTCLPILRKDRYEGEGNSVLMAGFDVADRERIRRLYLSMTSFYGHWLDMRTNPDFAKLRLSLMTDVAGLIDEAQQLGRGAPNTSESHSHLQKILHDIRGGGLTVFLGTADLLRRFPDNTTLIHKCVIAARDHAKIMRNAIPDLDPAVRAIDEANRTHDISDFMLKWDGLTIPRDKTIVHVKVHCTYHGGISARCLETSAIDRILYNYVNNALNYAENDLVTLWIFPIDRTLVRWVVHNTVSTEHKVWLERTTSHDLRLLFQGGFTRGGHGIGLNNCADFIANCFGVESIQAALDLQYLGARLVNNDYFAWFHWPGYEPD